MGLSNNGSRKQRNINIVGQEEHRGQASPEPIQPELNKHNTGERWEDATKKTKKQKKSRPGPERNGASRSNGCGRSSTDYSCLIKAMTYLNLTKTQVANYLKQQGRIVAANKTGEKKNGKKGIFASTAQRIIRSGGGNSAALSCQGSTTSNGAMNLTSLATLLNGCEAKVKATSSSDLAAAKESVDGSLATIKEDLEIATGSAPTDSEIESATTASSTATAASSARRNIVARHLLNRFNLN